MEKLKTFYRWVSELVSAYTLAAAIIPATVLAAMTAIFARYAAEPWHIVIFYSMAVICFAILSIGGYFWSKMYYYHYQRLIDPQDKLIIHPNIWYTLVGKKVQTLTEMQLGITLENVATFPIIYKVTKMRTNFDKFHLPNHLPWAEVELRANGGSGDSRDTTINYNPPKKMEQLRGEIEYSVEYWRVGEQKKYTATKNVELNCRFDLPAQTWTWRTI